MIENVQHNEDLHNEDLNFNLCVKETNSISETGISHNLNNNSIICDKASEIKSKENDKDGEFISQHFNSSEMWPTDPALYDFKTLIERTDLRHDIVKYGPCRPSPNEFRFPTELGRHFPTSYYEKRMQSGELIPRSWLCYSPKLDAAFCFACWIFAERNNHAYEKKISEIGVKDWKHFGQKINKHESSSIHLDSMCVWKLWKKGKVIDAELHKQEEDRVGEMAQIFHRFIDIILYLAKQNMAFRGDKEKIGEKSCGNFLATIELVAKYDSVLKNHLTKSCNLKYLSPAIQNELINIISKNIFDNIRYKIKEAKYFTIIADTTTDISHIEQLSIVIRYIKRSSTEERKCEIAESFAGFIPVSNPTASGIEQEILRYLEFNLQLDLVNCRGQGYDGAAVMSGVYNGVSQKILQKQPLAVYVHCAAHCLNLVLCDAAATSTEASMFFGVLHKLFVFLAGSNKRWHKFKSSNPDVNVKKICVTRWESRIDAVQAAIRSYSNIMKCLIEIKDDFRGNKREELIEASSLLNFIKKFTFILLLLVWEKVLVKVRVASKIFQKVNCDLTVATNILKATTEDLKEFRLHGFRNCYDEAKTFSENHEINVEFIKNRNASCLESSDPEKYFERFVFNTMIDRVVNELEMRFKGLKFASDNFQCLSPKNLTTLSDENMKKSCTQLSSLYSTDINETDFLSEVLSFRRMMPDIVKNDDSFSVLNYLLDNDLNDVYPNLVTAYRLLFTLPVTVASCERSFSKLKLIKNFLRSSMSQERLSALSLLSIENEFASSLDFDELIQQFARAKLRKGKF